MSCVKLKHWGWIGCNKAVVLEGANVGLGGGVLKENSMGMGVGLWGMGIVAKTFFTVEK